MKKLKNKLTKDKDAENVLNLKITKVILVHYNIVNNDYKQDSRVLYTFALKKSFDQLLMISSINFTFLKTIGSELLYMKVCFTD